jgi:hypothetical protein
MKHFLIALILVMTCFASPAQAQFVHRVTHYVWTHKELLGADLTNAGAFGADVGSSVHCQSVSRGCIETNPLMGRHPNEAKTAAWGLLATATFVTINHLIWHYGEKNDPPVKHMIWFSTAPVAIDEYFNVRSNVDAANSLQNNLRSRGILR